MSLGYSSLKAGLLFVFADFIRVSYTQISYGASQFAYFNLVGHSSNDILL